MSFRILFEQAHNHAASGQVEGAKGNPALREDCYKETRPP